MICGLLQNSDSRFSQEKALASQKQSLSNSIKEQNPFRPEPRIKGPTKEGSLAKDQSQPVIVWFPQALERHSSCCRFCALYAQRRGRRQQRSCSQELRDRSLRGSRGHRGSLLLSLSTNEGVARVKPLAAWRGGTRQRTPRPLQLFQTGITPSSLGLASTQTASALFVLIGTITERGTIIRPTTFFMKNNNIIVFPIRESQGFWKLMISYSLCSIEVECLAFYTER